MSKTIEDIRTDKSVQKLFGIARETVDQQQQSRELLVFIYNTLKLKGVIPVKLGDKATALGYPDIMYGDGGKSCALWVGWHDENAQERGVEMRKLMRKNSFCHVIRDTMEFFKYYNGVKLIRMKKGR